MVLGQGDHVVAYADKGCYFKFLLVAGQPIGEPIVQHGPFVMNTKVRTCITGAPSTPNIGN